MYPLYVNATKRTNSDAVLPDLRRKYIADQSGPKVRGRLQNSCVDIEANDQDQPVAAADLPCKKPPTATRLDLFVMRLLNVFVCFIIFFPMLDEGRGGKCYPVLAGDEIEC